jgi:hypothetical protein
MQLMNKIRNEQMLYLVVFLLSLGIRMLNLGDAALSDFEAGWALQSLGLAAGENVNLGPQPGYVFPTTIFFSLLGASNFVARLWPALAGSLIVLAPYAFRDRLGQKTAMIAAVGLSLDPGMVALSRLVGGPMPAIAFTILASAFFYKRQSALAGIMAGLALLSGPAVLIGLLGLGIAWGIASIMGLWRRDAIQADVSNPETPEPSTSIDWRTVLLFGGSTVLLIGTLFLFYPQGLGAWAASVSTFFQGWTQPSSIPAGRLIFSIAFYAVFALTFGLAAGLRGWLQGDKTAQFLSIWFLVGALIPLLYPARQVGDIAWALLPLWALAGLELTRSAGAHQHWLISLGQAAAVLVLMIVIWLTLAGLDTAIPETVQNYWFVVGAAALIGVLVFVMVYLGWGWQTARTGMIWGLAAGLGAYMISSAVGVSQVRPGSSLEFWIPAPTTRRTDLFTDTLKDLALSQTGHADFLEVVSLVDEPSMRWVLRDIEGLTFISSLGEEENPLVIITRDGDPIGARQAYYRGQDFGWWESPGWGGAIPWEPLRWIINRQGVVNTERVVLWARVDLFPEEPEAVEEPLLVPDTDFPSPSSDEGVEP